MATLGAFAIIFDDRGHVLCVRTTYGEQRWTTPGGRVEPNESPIEALRREVREETGFEIAPGPLIGVYAKPFQDDLVMAFYGEVLHRHPWQPDDEIAEFAFCNPMALPAPMTIASRSRIVDAVAGRRGIYRVFATAADLGGHLAEELGL